MKRILSLLLCAAMLLTLAPMALAEEAPQNIAPYGGDVSEADRGGNTASISLEEDAPESRPLTGEVASATAEAGGVETGSPEGEASDASMPSPLGEGGTASAVTDEGSNIAPVGEMSFAEQMTEGGKTEKAPHSLAALDSSPEGGAIEPAETEEPLLGATSGTCGDNLTWSLDDAGTLSIVGTGSMYTYSNNSPWISRSDIKSVVISEGVTTISATAFHYCAKLSSVSIPTSVKKIGHQAFAISGLTNLTIPSGVTSIGTSAFNGCLNLPSINVSPDNSSFTSIDGVLFSKDGTTLIQCPSGKTGSYVVPSHTKTIGHWAFRQCHKLTSIVIPSSVTSIEMDGLFEGCNCLKVLFGYCDTNLRWELNIDTCVLSFIGEGEIPNYPWVVRNGMDQSSAPWQYYWEYVKSVYINYGVTKIGYYSFAYCYNLVSVSIPNSVFEIGDHAFAYCYPLTNIKIPDSVTAIYRSAFVNCSLTDISIPNGIRSLNENLFIDCGKLQSVFIPYSVTTINRGTFSGCSSLTDVYYGGTEAQWKAISVGGSNTPLLNATIHYNSVGVSEQNTALDETHRKYQILAQHYPLYLDNNAANNYYGTAQSICYDVVQQYNGTDNVLLSFAESFVNGSKILIKDIGAALGLTQSTRDEWLEKNTLSYVKAFQGENGALKAIDDSWKTTFDTYKEFKLSYKMLDNASKAAFIEGVTSTSQKLSGETVQKITDEVFKNQDLLGFNSAGKIVKQAGYAVDMLDVALLTCQLFEVELGTLERLQRLLPNNTPLYEIKKDPGRYACEKYIKKQCVDKMAEALSKFGAWAAGKATDSYLGVASTLVQLTASLLYNYIYQGPKIDEVYGAVVAYDFYATTEIARLDLYSQLRNNRLNGVASSQQLLDDYELICEAKRIALYQYADACATINKESGYKSLLNSIKDDADVDSVIGFDNYITVCYNALQKDISSGTVSCSHPQSHTVTKVQPICTARGYDRIVCDVCGAQWDGNYINALGHNYTSAVTAPTCTAAGYTKYTCTRCGDTYTANTVSAKGHSWNSGTVTKAATCTESGVRTYTCTVCGATQTETIATLGHDWSAEKVVLREPAANLPGVRAYICSRCDEHKDEETFLRFLLGDANGDGAINGKDVTVLRRFLVGGYDAVIREDNSDVNSDAIINGKDVTHLRRYFAGGYGLTLN